ncbi:MAG: hypothetical protein JEY96_19695 [Bacteroidales bacterium]|nr:hypothetical protein [Bacteroidales bacterium]
MKNFKHKKRLQQFVLLSHLFSEDVQVLRMKNPDLTPLYGLERWFKADNRAYAATAIRPSPKLKLAKKQNKTVGFALWAKHSFSCASTSHMPGPLSAMNRRRGVDSRTGIKI